MAEESQAVSKARWKMRKGKQEAAEPPGGCRVDGGPLRSALASWVR